MLRPIVLAASMLPVLAGQVAAPSQGTGAMTPVTEVTKAPRVAEIEFVGFDFQRPQPAHGGVFLFGIEGEPAEVQGGAA